MSEANESQAEWYTNTETQINRYFTTGVFGFGTIGNTLNILILSQRSLRSNPCTWLFLMSSYSNLICILFGLTTRMKSGWDRDLTETVGWLCKLRAFVVFSSRTMALWLITLATIERWLSSCKNANYRKLSSLKNAQRSTIVIVLISLLVYVPTSYCYDANLIGAPLKCYGKDMKCRQLTSFTYVFITVLCPLFLMFLFGCMTVSNVRQCQRRTNNLNHINLNAVTPANVRILNEQPKRLKKKTDQQLLFIILIQVLLLTILTLPQAIQKIYSTIVQRAIYSSFDQAVFGFYYNLFLILSFIASGMPFYIYTLCGGSIFRKALYDLIHMIIKRRICLPLAE